MGARQPLPPRRAELSGPMLGLWAKCCDLCFGSKEGSAEGGRGGRGGGGTNVRFEDRLVGVVVSVASG